MDSPWFQYKTTVLETMLDVMDHLNHAFYLTLFENARWELCTQQGFGLDAMRRQKRSFVILEASIKYLKEVKSRDQLAIHTRFLGLDKKIWTIEQTMTRAGEILCCSAQFKAGLFDLEARKLLVPDQDWINNFSEVKVR